MSKDIAASAPVWLSVPFGGWLVWLVAVAGLAGANGSHQSGRAAWKSDGAWSGVAEPAAGSLQRRCANWTDWTVDVRLASDGEVVVAKAPANQLSGAPAELPFAVVSEVKVAGRILATKISEGYLVAFNHGEFGGSLWLYDATGVSRRRLADARVVGFVEIELPGRRVLAGVVEGLAHMGMDEGRLAVVEQDASGTIAVTKLRDLTSAPQVVGQSNAAGVVVATGDGVIRIDRRGVVQTLASVDMRDFYPRSIVEASGLILVGMRRYLLEIDPQVKPPRISWFTDASCRTFRPVEPVSCECR